MCVQDSMSVHEEVMWMLRPRPGKDQSMSGIHSLIYNFWGLSLSSLSCWLVNQSAQTHRVPSLIYDVTRTREDRLGVECWGLHLVGRRRWWDRLSITRKISLTLVRKTDLLHCPVSTSAHSQAAPDFKDFLEVPLSPRWALC